MNFNICKSCNNKVEYELRANCIIFCPNCFQTVFIECEYGFGPVTPCYIFLGKIEIGKVIEVNDKYILKSQYFNEDVELKNRYMEALQEATEIIKKKLESIKE